MYSYTLFQVLHLDMKITRSNTDVLKLVFLSIGHFVKKHGPKLLVTRSELCMIHSKIDYSFSYLISL